MKLKKIQQVVYEYGDEYNLQKLLYKSKEPILIRIKDFTDQFTLDFFIKNSSGQTTYSTFENEQCINHQTGDLKTLLDEIKHNKAHRIFGHYYPRRFTEEIEKHVPLWQTIPFRPRFCSKYVKCLLFFCGKGSNTQIHYDREHPCILHLCLSGKKEMLLFTKEQNKHLYKVPFVGDSLIDFSLPRETIAKQFPETNKAEGYEVILEKGDMLFMPRNCWHYTRYHDASAAASYVFYPNKFMQFYGYFTGFFYVGYKEATGFRVNNWPLFKKLDQTYPFATGQKKFFLKILEVSLYIFLLPCISILAYISAKLRPRKFY